MAGSGFLDELPLLSRGLLIEGNAGIGKTYQWTRILADASSRGWRTLQAHPGEAETRLGGVGLIDLLGDVTDDEIATLPAPQQRALAAALLRRTAEGPPPDPQIVAVALTTLIHTLAGRVPVLIAVDDLQWLDPTTGGALAFLARRCPDRGVGFLLTLRTPIEATPHPAAELEERGALDRLPVAPLDQAEIAALVRERLSFRVPGPVLARAAATSGGNPFYAVELAKMWTNATDSFLDALPVPPSLQALVGSRLEVLPERTRSALAAVSAVGHATIPLLRALGLADALAPAERGGVVTVAQGTVRFSHPLLRAACYDALTGSERTELHRRLAEIVDDPEPRARHLALGAEEPDAAIAAQLDSAVQLAEQRADVNAAIDAARLALRVSPPGDPETAQRRLTLGRLLFKSGDGDAARGELDRLTDEDTPRRVRVRALTMLCELAFATVSHEVAQEYGRAAIRAADPVADADLLADAHIYFAQGVDDIDVARGHAATALAIVESTPEPEPARHAKALALSAGLEFFSGNGLDRAAFERARQLEEAGAVPAEESMTGYYLAVLSYADEDAAATELCDSWQQRCRDEGCDSQQPFILMWRSHLELKSGRLGRAEQTIRLHIAVAEQAGHEHSARYGRYNLSRLALARGDLDQARQLAEMLIAAPAGAAIETIAHRALGEAALYDGDLDAAVTHLRRVDALRAHGRDDPSALLHLEQLAEALLALGQLAEAEDAISLFADRARALRRHSALAQLARYTGLQAAAQGEKERALAAFDEALGYYDRPEFLPFDRARTLLLKGQVLRRFRHKAQTKDTLELARDAFAMLGAPGWIARVDGELARVGLRPPAPSELTPTEWRVAELVATGMSAKEVAGTLFLSPRTVEAHLASIYRKLGIRSRAELGARLVTSRASEAAAPSP